MSPHSDKATKGAESSYEHEAVEQTSWVQHDSVVDHARRDRDRQ
jgi:hypothetical protein